jgi:uncharacterized RDD family membrane protein YckC
LVIQTLAPAAGSLVRIGPSPSALKALNADPSTPAAVKNVVTTFANGHGTVAIGFDNAALTLAFLLYVIVLVALIGQTFGMMVSDVRVVGADRSARVGFGRAVARYFSLFLSLIGVVGWFSLFRRVQPFERWSRTRLVSGAVRS